MVHRSSSVTNNFKVLHLEVFTVADSDMICGAATMTEKLKVVHLEVSNVLVLMLFTGLLLCVTSRKLY